MRIVLDVGEDEGARGSGLEEPKTISERDEKKVEMRTYNAKIASSGKKIWRPNALGAP